RELPRAREGAATAGVARLGGARGRRGVGLRRLRRRRRDARRGRSGRAGLPKRARRRPARLGSGPVPDALRKLRLELAQIADLGVAARALEWDQLVMMPEAGASTRPDTLATLQRLGHELFVRDEIGELLESLEPGVADLDPESDDACLVDVTRRDWDKARRIPSELTAEMTKLASEGM